MDKVSEDACSVLELLDAHPYTENNPPKGVSYDMFEYLKSVGYVAFQTWSPPRPDSPYRDEQQGLIAYAITEKGREYLRLMREQKDAEEQRAKDAANERRKNTLCALGGAVLSALLGWLLAKL